MAKRSKSGRPRAPNPHPSVEVDRGHFTARGWAMDPENRAWRYQPRDRTEWGDSDYWRYALGKELDTTQDVEEALAERYSSGWWPWIIEPMVPPAGRTPRRRNVTRRKNARTPLDNMAWHSDTLVRDVGGAVDDRDGVDPADVAEAVVEVWEEYDRGFEEPRSNKYMTREEAADSIYLADAIVDWANYGMAYGEFGNPPWRDNAYGMNPEAGGRRQNYGALTVLAWGAAGFAAGRFLGRSTIEKSFSEAEKAIRKEDFNRAQQALSNAAAQIETGYAVGEIDAKKSMDYRIELVDIAETMPQRFRMFTDPAPLANPASVYSLERYPVAELEGMDTITSGHMHNLVVEDDVRGVPTRWWLSRMTAEDGETSGVYVEQLIDGRWQDVHQYGRPATYDERFGNPRACALPGSLSTEDRNELPAKAFGLPKQRKYPMYRMVKGNLVPSSTHASDAKGRAQAQYNKGKLSKADLKKIDRKADKVLAECGVGGSKRNPMSDDESAEWIEWGKPPRSIRVVMEPTRRGDRYSDLEDEYPSAGALEDALREENLVGKAVVVLIGKEAEYTAVLYPDGSVLWNRVDAAGHRRMVKKMARKYRSYRNPDTSRDAARKVTIK